MDEIACPKCKTTKYRNPSLKLMVNECGHAICENCVEIGFVRGSGACPECGIGLRRSNFRLQLFEDAKVEKEVDIRKRIMRDYNKREEDFPTLRLYNDYLENLENMIFNLTNGIDVEETKMKMEAYKKENHDQIKRNRSKLNKDERMLQEMIDLERQENEFYREQTKLEAKKADAEKRRNKQALIDELMFSDVSAEEIVASHRREQQMQQEEVAAKPRIKPSLFSSGIAMGHREIDTPLFEQEVGELFHYQPLETGTCGPDPPTLSQIMEDGFLTHVRPASNMDMGGGYITHMGCQRALQEAFCGLFFTMRDRSALAEVT